MFVCNQGSRPLGWTWNMYRYVMSWICWFSFFFDLREGTKNLNSAKREGLELPFLILTFILRKDVTYWPGIRAYRGVPQKSSSENCIQINYTVTEWKWIWNWSFKSIWMEWMGRDSHIHTYIIIYLEFSIESNVTLTCWSKPQQL